MGSINEATSSELRLKKMQVTNLLGWSPPDQEDSGVPVPEDNTLCASTEWDYLHLQQRLIRAKVYLIIRFINCFFNCAAVDQVDQPVLGPVHLLVILGGATHDSVVNVPAGALPNSMTMEQASHAVVVVDASLPL